MKSIWHVIISLLCFSVAGEAEECSVNFCANDETCHDRPNSPYSTFVCECTDAMRYDCGTPTDVKSIQSCYGSTCTTGSFSSPYYPNLYSSDDSRLYLIFIPDASQITLTFSSYFDIAQNDDLYVGSGLQYFESDVSGRQDVPWRQVFYIDGGETPTPITLTDTDAAWIYFRTDATDQRAGFEVVWSTDPQGTDLPKTSGIDNTPPIVICPSNITQTVELGIQKAVIFFPNATAFDDTGVVTLVSVSHPPGSQFPANSTTIVTFTYVDGSANQASCSFFITINTVTTKTPMTGPPSTTKGMAKPSSTTSVTTKAPMTGPPTTKGMAKPSSTTSAPMTGPPRTTKGMAKPSSTTSVPTKAPMTGPPRTTRGMAKPSSTTSETTGKASMPDPPRTTPGTAKSSTTILGLEVWVVIVIIVAIVGVILVVIMLIAIRCSKPMPAVTAVNKKRPVSSWPNEVYLGKDETDKADDAAIAGDKGYGSLSKSERRYVSVKLPDSPINKDGGTVQDVGNPNQVLDSDGYLVPE